jgi:molecular chaperone HtpG
MVTVSKRLVITPCVIVIGEYGWTADFQRLMNTQALDVVVHAAEEDT